MLGATALDIAAFVIFIACWAGYTVFADHRRGDGKNLVTVMDVHRLEWMRRMMDRENRMVDASIMATAMRVVSLFASTSLIILIGLMAMLGSMDKAKGLIAAIPYTMISTSAMLELKIMLLVVIFIFAFFKFAWTLRQMNYTMVMIGAAKPFEGINEAEREVHAKRTARVVSLAMHSFNRGLRAYYFGIATISWFLHPVLFMGASVWVVLVVYRREFHSRTLMALGDDGGGVESGGE